MIRILPESLAPSTAQEETPSAPTDALDAGSKRPNVPEVRGQIPDEVSARSTFLGLFVFFVVAGLYGLSWWAILAAPWWPLQIAAAIANGIFSTTIFVVGHDACHGSLTPIPWLNQVLGRINFLPSLTPYVTWEYAHNRVHHSYTNLKPRDYAWAPYSKEEYDSLPWRRRMLERHYRTPFGLGHYYLIEYWLKHLLTQSREERQEMKKPFLYLFDLALVTLFAIAQFAVIISWANAQTPGPGYWAPFTTSVSLIVVAWVVPFLMWNWLMGFAIFQHHNHQGIAWYDKREEWDFFAAQIESTVHIEMPTWMEWVSARIMQHTAHHVNPKIPLYRLTASQQCLERAYPREIVVQTWRLGSLSRTMSLCKLYDFKNHRWLNFAGMPTTQPHGAIREMRKRLPTS